MMDQSGRGFALDDCTPQSLHDQVVLHVCSYRIPDDALRKAVDDSG